MMDPALDPFPLIRAMDAACLELQLDPRAVDKMWLVEAQAAARGRIAEAWLDGRGAIPAGSVH